MFVVTYNFNDMPVNHMTFLRQRIFLVPVEEGAEGKGEASARERGASPGRPKSLCYLMHLRCDPPPSPALPKPLLAIESSSLTQSFSPCLPLSQISEFQIWEDLLAQRHPPAVLTQIHRSGCWSPLRSQIFHRGAKKPEIFPPCVTSPVLPTLIQLVRGGGGGGGGLLLERRTGHWRRRDADTPKGPTGLDHGASVKHVRWRARC